MTFPNRISLRLLKVSKGAKIRNRYNQMPHLTQDTNVDLLTCRPGQLIVFAAPSASSFLCSTRTLTRES